MNREPPFEYEDLLKRFRDLGADDPEGWAGSETREHIAQLARFCFLRGLWRDVIDTWTTSDKWIDEGIAASDAGGDPPFADAGLSLKRILDAGVAPADLQRVARFIAYATAFEVVNRVDGGYDSQLDDSYPGWRLVETTGDELTGRDVGGLHESLLETDPSGREGRP